MKFFYLIFCGILIVGCSYKKNTDKDNRTFSEYSEPYPIEDIQLLIDGGVSLLTTEQEQKDNAFYIYPLFFNQLSLKDFRNAFDTTEYAFSNDEYNELIKDFYFLQGNSVEKFIFQQKKELVCLPYQGEKRTVILISSPMFVDKRRIAVIYVCRYFYKAIEDRYGYFGVFVVLKNTKHEWHIEKKIIQVIDSVSITYKVPKASL